MKHRLEVIACRRSQLLKRIKSQRIDMHEISQQFQRPLAVVDAGIKVVHFMRRHPTLLASCFALLLALRRRDFAGLKQHGLHLLRIYPVSAYLNRSDNRQKQI